jgi:calcium binding protein 39
MFLRSKPRTPPELVQHVRELLTYVRDHREGRGGKRESKREQKVSDGSLQVCISFAYAATRLFMI